MAEQLLNVGDAVEGRLPAPMKRVIATEAEREDTTTSAFVRGIHADSLKSMT